jgi:hypothetical protein
MPTLIHTNIDANQSRAISQPPDMGESVCEPVTPAIPVKPVIKEVKKADASLGDCTCFFCRQIR